MWCYALFICLEIRRCVLRWEQVMSLCKSVSARRSFYSAWLIRVCLSEIKTDPQHNASERRGRRACWALPVPTHTPVSNTHSHAARLSCVRMCMCMCVFSVSIRPWFGPCWHAGMSGLASSASHTLADDSPSLKLCHVGIYHFSSAFSCNARLSHSWVSSSLLSCLSHVSHKLADQALYLSSLWCFRVTPPGQRSVRHSRQLDLIHQTWRTEINPQILEYIKYNIIYYICALKRFLAFIKAIHHFNVPHQFGNANVFFFLHKQTWIMMLWNWCSGFIIKSHELSLSPNNYDNYYYYYHDLFWIIIQITISAMEELKTFNVRFLCIVIHYSL